MFFDAAKTESALGAVVPPKAPGSGQNRNLSQKQFGKTPGGSPDESPVEGAGAEGAAGAGAGEAAGAAGIEELAPLLLLA